MITKEQLLMASYSGKRCCEKNIPYKGVLTTEEAKLYLRDHRGLICISNVYTNQFFFSDDHCFGVYVLPDEWVPCTSKIPQLAKEREGLEDGIIDTVEKYNFVYNKDNHQITTIDELVKILNQENNE